MRIGIDARFLTHPQCGGFKTYTRSLISALAAVETDNEYVLYTDRPAKLDLAAPPNFTVKPIVATFPLREQFLLPMAMAGDRVDVAHFPCNTGPIVCPTPVVVNIHDTIALRAKPSGGLSLRHGLLRRYWRLVTPWCARRARLVIAISDFSAGDICATLHLPVGKMRVVYPAIDPAFRNGAPAASPPGIEPAQSFILAFASSDERKNPKGAIRGFRLAAEEFPLLKLVLVCSDTKVTDELRATGGDGVVPTGPVSTEQLLWLYRNARALVFPSLNEGFGLPPLEAMACGTPVVASNAGALPEVLGDSALFVNPRCEESIAQGIRTVLGNAELRDRLRARGTEHAARFTQERMASRIVKAYTEAAGRP